MTARSKTKAETGPPEHIGRLLLRAHRSFGARFVAGLEGLGHRPFSMAHLSILPHIEPGGTRASVLVERTGLSKQSVAQLLSELEAEDYIRREKDAEDGRAAVILMTSRGEAVYRDAKKVKREIERDCERRLGEEGLAGLRRALTALIDE